MTPPPGLPQLPAEIETLLRAAFDCSALSGRQYEISGFESDAYGETERRFYEAKQAVLLALAARERRVREETTALTMGRIRQAMKNLGVKAAGTYDDPQRWSLDDLFTDIRALPPSPEGQP